MAKAPLIQVKSVKTSMCFKSLSKVKPKDLFTFDICVKDNCHSLSFFYSNQKGDKANFLCPPVNFGFSVSVAGDHILCNNFFIKHVSGIYHAKYDKQFCIFFCTQIPQGQVDSLPVNFFVNNLLSMVSLHSERSNVECDNCDSGDPAVNRCTTCCHFLCEICTGGHKRGRSTKPHRLMSLEEAKEEGPQAVVRPSFCKEHEGEMLKLFCETCGEAICRDCTIVKHREHKYSFVKEAFLKGKASVSKILSQTKTRVSTLKKALESVSEMKSRVNSRADQTVEDVALYLEELTEHLNIRFDELIILVEELREGKLQSLNVQQEKLETALRSVESSVEFTERAFETGSEVEFLNMHKQMSSRLQELNSTQWQLELCADDSMKLKVDDQLKRDIATFGVITDVVTHSGTSTVTMGHGSEGVMYRTLCGQPIEFTITAKEQNGRKRTEGGDMFEAFFSHDDVKQPLKVHDCGNGAYTFCCSPKQTGQFKLSVFVMGDHVQGSPFTWIVVKWNLTSISTENKEGQVKLSEQNLMARYIYKAPPCNNSGSVHYVFQAAPYGNPYNLQSSRSAASCRVSQSDSQSKRSLSQPLYVVGSHSFSVNKYLWRVKLSGNVSKGFSFGVIPTSRVSHTALLSTSENWWVWNSNWKHLFSSSNVQQLKSSITNCASNDIIEMYLDCDNGTLMMYNQRTKQSDTWGGVTKGVCPVLQMTTDGHQVSLKV